VNIAARIRIFGRSVPKFHNSPAQQKLQRASKTKKAHSTIVVGESDGAAKMP
jgi:hypothetical protein